MLTWVGKVVSMACAYSAVRGKILSAEAKRTVHKWIGLLCLEIDQWKRSFLLGDLL